MNTTPPTAWVGLLVCLVGAPGCKKDEAPCDAVPSGRVRVQYGVSPTTLTPFPWDLYTRNEATSRTGLRVALPPGGPRVLQPGLGLLRPVEQVIELLHERNGFSLQAPILMPVSGALDPESLPQTLDDTVALESPVYLLEAPGDAAAVRVPIHVTTERFHDPLAPAEHLLVLRPDGPLRAETRHVVVVTRQVRDATGNSLVAPVDFKYVSGHCAPPVDHPEIDSLAAERIRLAFLFAPPFELDPDELAVAFSFTTQSTEAEIDSLREQILDSGLPPPVADFDPSGDGTPDLYDPFDVPGAPVDIPLAEHIDLVARGTFSAPEFRTDEGFFDLDADGRPEIQYLATLPFLLVLPADPAAQPCPVVIVSHGNGATKENALFVAGHLAEQGLATLAVDLPEHGEAPTLDTGFFNFVNTEYTAVNFRQAVANFIRLTQLLQTSLTTVDFIPAGVGDGQPDLGQEPIAFVGESLGSMVGVLFAAQEPDVGAIVVNVGGGGFTHFIAAYSGGVLEPHLALPFEVGMQTLMDPVDPASVALRFQSGTGRQVLVQEVMDDHMIPNAATEELCRLMGVPLIRPFTEPVDGLEVVDAPASSRGLFQYHPARHGFLMAEDDHPEASAAARRQIARFLASYFRTGTGLIEDPW